MPGAAETSRLRGIDLRIRAAVDGYVKDSISRTRNYKRAGNMPALFSTSDLLWAGRKAMRDYFNRTIFLVSVKDPAVSRYMYIPLATACPPPSFPSQITW
jgi:hypothetical protein